MPPPMLEVVDATVDDEEIEIQNSIFERVMSACNGHPRQRAMQVLVDALACAAVSTRTPLSELIEAVKLSFNDSLPKGRREN